MRLLEVVHWKIAQSRGTGDGMELLPYLLMLASQKSTVGTMCVSPRGGPPATQSHVCAALQGIDSLLGADNALTKTKDKIPIDTSESRIQLSWFKWGV